MEQQEFQTIVKILWIGLVLVAIYYFSWMTLGNYTFGNMGIDKYNVWNLILPNCITIVVLILYTKELLLGYRPISKKNNVQSLILFSIIILSLIIIQLPQFEILIEDLNIQYWPLYLALSVILTAYIGLLMNRISRLNTV